MRTAHRVATLMILCAACSAADYVAVAQGPLTLDRGLVYEMTREGNHWVARVYVTPKPEEAARLALALRGVASGSRSDPALTSVFLPPRRVPETGAITAFDVVTRDGAAVPRGTYDLLLTESAGEKSQPLNLQVTVPAAVVKQPGTLLVTRVLPIVGNAEGINSGLLIAETGQKSPASLAIVQQDHFADANGVYDGQMQFSTVTIGPGQTTLIPYQVRGDFPLGNARANLALWAPEMESPLTIAVEVRTRRTRALLLFVIVMGLLMGFLMRTVLKQRIQFGEVQQKAIDLSRKLERERDSVPDSSFRGRVDRAVKALITAVKESRLDKASELTDAVSAAERALADAQADLQQRSQAVADELKGLAVILKTSWRLPKQMQDRVSAAAEALERAQELNTGGDAAAARQLLDSTREALGKSLAQYASRWKQDLPDLAAGLKHATSVLLPDQRQEYSEEVKRTVTLSDQLTDRLEDDNPASLKALLTTLDNALESTRRVLNRLRIGALETWRAMVEALGRTEPPIPQEWNRAKTETKEFGEWLRSASVDLNEVGDLRQRVSGLVKTWMDAVDAQRDDKDTKELMAKGDYVAAVTHLAKLITAHAESIQGDEEPGTNRDDAVSGSGAAVAPVFSPNVVAPAQPALFESFYPAKRTPITMEILAANTLTELLAARWLLTSLSATGLALVGYLLFADKFVGTSGDLMTAFFWGFTTDIGLDALISAAAKKKTAEP
jgi:hypothetical protein